MSTIQSSPSQPNRVIDVPEVHADHLGEAIAELSARIQAATYELLVLIRRFDEQEAWNTGFASCAHWLNWRTGLDLGAAREKVRVARALADLPRLSAAMGRGEISYSKVRALTRVATAESEAQLLEFAQAGTASHVERLVRAWRRVDRIEAARETERRHQQRHLQTWVDDDGMLVVRGRLTPEVGAVLERALDAAAEQLYQESAKTPAPETPAEEVSPAQRRADAIGLIAESALASGLDRGTAGDRYQVVVHVDASALQSAPDSTEPDPGQAVLEDDLGYVSAETSQRISCDAATVVMQHAADGSVLDVGRKTRTIPPPIRRALVARDRRCCFPGCTARRCDAHHIKHWADGGTTSLDNLALLCRRHHRVVHEEGFTLARQHNGTVVIHRPDGRRLTTAPPAPRLTGLPLAPIAAQSCEDGTSATRLWQGEPFDVAWGIDVLRVPPTGTVGADVSAGTSG